MRLTCLLLKNSSEAMTKEEEVFQRHLLDLADLAWKRSITVYTDFLNLNEQNIFHDIQQSFSGVQTKTFGGYDCAERQMVAFIPDALSYDSSFDRENTFPIRCLKISPKNVRFSEELTHRDYLGALMNLGVERSKLGDIALCGTDALLFCEANMAEYLEQELTRVRHTAVSCREIDCKTLHYEPKLQEITGSVASVRLDALISLAFGMSRSSLAGLIESGKTFVNGRLTTSNGYHLKERDLISVRGYGRFRYCGVRSESKKGRLFVRLEKYV